MPIAKPNILILAQIPPPFHGQSVMLKYLVDAKWDWCNKAHIRLKFSSHIDEVGKFYIKKLWQLLIVIIKIISERLKHKIDICYYPPSLTGRIPFYRDLIIVLILKITSNKIVFHFHSGGADYFYNRLCYLEKLAARIVLCKVDLVISLLPSLIQETEFLKPKKHQAISNGIEDQQIYHIIDSGIKEKIVILFLGNLLETKGIFDLLEATIILRKKGFLPIVNYIGSWESENTRTRFLTLVNENLLSDSVKLLGIKTGNDKYSELHNSDIFCFPTYYPAENQPLVLLEAMMFSLPIITTRWRATPDIITDGEEGFLIPINSPKLLAEKLQLLIEEKEMRITMGKNGREKYLKKYTLQKHLNEMETVFKKIASEE